MSLKVFLSFDLLVQDLAALWQNALCAAPLRVDFSVWAAHTCHPSTKVPPPPGFRVVRFLDYPTYI